MLISHFLSKLHSTVYRISLYGYYTLGLHYTLLCTATENYEVVNRKPFCTNIMNSEGLFVCNLLSKRLP